jgi:hypothetical protein
MNLKPLFLTLLGITLASTGLSAAGTQLSAGKYMSILSPSVDEKQADKIEKQLGKIQEIGSIDVKPKDSTLHFTVKDNAQLELARVTNAVKVAVPGTAVGEPTSEPIPGTSGTTGTSPLPPTGGY